MSPRQSDTRHRLVMAAAEMLARHGCSATSIREMAKHAGAPLGSTYHHFPQGKEQVILEALDYAGQRVSSGLQQHLTHGLAHGLRDFLWMWRDILVRSDFHIGCPVLAVAVEEPLDEVAANALAAASRIFTDWEQQLTQAMCAEGLDQDSANALATLIIAAVEGAIGLARAQRSTAPFDRVTQQLESIVRQAVKQSQSEPK